MIRILTLTLILTLMPGCRSRTPGPTTPVQSVERRLATANQLFATAINSASKAVIEADKNKHLDTRKAYELLLYFDKLAALSSRVANWQRDGNTIASLRQELLDLIKFVTPSNYLLRRFDGQPPKGITLAATALDVAINRLREVLQ